MGNTLILLIAASMAATMAKPTPALPDSAGNSTIEIRCPGKVIGVDIEVGHHVPYPDLIIPDVGANGEVPYVEWNELSVRQPNMPPVTAHCYTKKGAGPSSDVNIPPSVKKCALRDNEFTCA